MNSIPTRHKLKSGQGKVVLRKAMEPFLPKEIVYREKAGFGLPIRAWLNHRNDMVSHYLDMKRIERQGIFKASAVEKMLKEQFSGSYDHSHLLYALLTQQMWLELNSIGI